MYTGANVLAPGNLSIHEIIDEKECSYPTCVRSGNVLVLISILDCADNH